jgi:hypothetical protein
MPGYARAEMELDVRATANLSGSIDLLGLRGPLHDYFQPSATSGVASYTSLEVYGERRDDKRAPTDCLLTRAR